MKRNQPLIALIASFVVIVGFFVHYSDSIVSYFLERYCLTLCYELSQGEYHLEDSSYEDHLLAFEGLSLKAGGNHWKVGHLNLVWELSFWPPRILVDLRASGVEGELTQEQLPRPKWKGSWLQLRDWIVTDLTLVFPSRDSLWNGSLMGSGYCLAISGILKNSQGRELLATLDYNAGKGLWKVTWNDQPFESWLPWILKAFGSRQKDPYISGIFSGSLEGVCSFHKGGVVFGDIQGRLKASTLFFSDAHRRFSLGDCEAGINAFRGHKGWELSGDVSFVGERGIPSLWHYGCDWPNSKSDLFEPQELWSFWTAETAHSAGYRAIAKAEECDLSYLSALLGVSFNVSGCGSAECQFNKAGSSLLFAVREGEISSSIGSLILGEGSTVQLLSNKSADNYLGMLRVKNGSMQMGEYRCEGVAMEGESLGDVIHINRFLADCQALHLLGSATLTRLDGQERYHLALYPEVLEGVLWPISGNFPSPLVGRLLCNREESVFEYAFDGKSSSLKKWSLSGYLQDVAYPGGQLSLNGLSCHIEADRGGIRLGDLKGLVLVPPMALPLECSSCCWDGLKGSFSELRDNGRIWSGEIEKISSEAGGLWMSLADERQKIRARFSRDLALEELHSSVDGTLSDFTTPLNLLKLSNLFGSTFRALEGSLGNSLQIKGEVSWRVEPEGYSLTFEKDSLINCQGFSFVLQGPWHFYMREGVPFIEEVMVTLKGPSNFISNVRLFGICTNDAGCLVFRWPEETQNLILNCTPQELRFSWGEGAHTLVFSLAQGDSIWDCHLYFESKSLIICDCILRSGEGALKFLGHLLPTGELLIDTVSGKITEGEISLKRISESFAPLEFEGKIGSYGFYPSLSKLFSLPSNLVSLQCLQAEGRWSYAGGEIGFIGELKVEGLVLGDYLWDRATANLVLKEGELELSNGQLRSTSRICQFEKFSYLDSHWRGDHMELEAHIPIGPLCCSRVLMDWLEGDGLALEQLKGRGKMTFSPPPLEASFGTLVLPAFGKVGFEIASGRMGLSSLERVYSRNKSAKYTLWSEEGPSFIDFVNQTLALKIRLKHTPLWMKRAQLCHMRIEGSFSDPKIVWREGRAP